MQIGIRNTESRISISAMPSMPSAQAKRPKSGDMLDELPLRRRRSRSCAQSRMPSARSTSVASSAIQRARVAPDEQAGDRRDHRHRQHQREDRKAASRSSRHRPGRGAGKAEQHHQRIGIEIAGLQPRGEPLPPATTSARRRSVRSGRSCPRRPSSRRSGRARTPGGRKADRRARRNTICCSRKACSTRNCVDEAAGDRAGRRYRPTRRSQSRSA